jgi:hypothetical protein
MWKIAYIKKSKYMFAITWVTSDKIFIQDYVSHTCNPSYLGGRDQKDHGLKPGQANSLQDPISKKPITKKGWWSSSSSTEKKKRPCQYGFRE